MNAEGKTKLANTVLQALGIMSIFYAGFILERLFALAVFLFVGGIVVSQVEVTFHEEGDKTE